jgi:hypothetical protein
VSIEPREELAVMLGKVRGDGSFATRRTAPAAGLKIDVRDVGPLTLPVPASQARQLRLIARPAMYGQGERTILDRRVRDTWEVPRSRVRIDQRHWNQTLRPILATVRDDLALPATVTLTAELHSMLVYEPGQYFAAHQDSEKHNDMIATLVVMLPSRSTGGDLVVTHRNRTVRYAGSATALTFVAFYADTRHEVLPVETGYRVVLTYNLTATGADGDGGGADGPVGAVSELLRRHFSHRATPRWLNDRQALDPPDRLVMLLDHQYTERGLRWSHLKGDDATRATVLRAAAEDAGCEVILAHAEVHETRECDDDGPRWRRGRWSAWNDTDDEDDDDGFDDDGVEVGDLIDSTVTITAVPGQGHRVTPRVEASELAEITPTSQLTPYQSDHTGYMGNWGNTMDRWYRRAAIVLWPRTRAFAIRAKADPCGALDELLTSTDRGETDPLDLTEKIEAFLRFWPDAVRSDDAERLHSKALRLGSRITDPTLVAFLIEPFTITTVTANDADTLIALAERHGIDWLTRIVTGWFAPRHRPTSGQQTVAAWAVTLPALCDSLLDNPHQASGLGIQVATAITHATTVWLLGAVGQAVAITTPSRRAAALTTLAAPTLAVLRAAAHIGATTETQQITDTICEPALVPLLVEVIRDAASLPPSGRPPALDGIAGYCRNELAAMLLRPERGADDWSIRGFPAGGCCGDCHALGEFLIDPDARKVTWPLAKPRRQHLHHRIDDAELPVTHTTVREGSPHKLVLTKTADVHHRDAAMRSWAASALADIDTYLATPTRKTPSRASSPARRTR